MKQHAAQIVAAYVRRNRISATEVPALIEQVSQTLLILKHAPVALEPLKPSVPIRASVGADTITCLECGHSGTMLKRHLSRVHGLTPDEYRIRWTLPQKYPMVAKNYSAWRSELAKAIKFGHHGGRRPAQK